MAISPKIPAVGPMLIRYNNDNTMTIRTTKLSRSNNSPVGKNCEKSIITVRTMKYISSVWYIPLYIVYN